MTWAPRWEIHGSPWMRRVFIRGRDGLIWTRRAFGANPQRSGDLLGEASAFCSRFSPGTAVPTHSTWDCICKAFHSKSLTTTGLKNARPRHLSALCGPPGFRGSCCLHTGGGNGSVLRTDNQQHHGPRGTYSEGRFPSPEVQNRKPSGWALQAAVPPSST